jgi:adenylylsulfate kinase
MEERKATNVVYQPPSVDRKERAKLLGHRSFTLWFTGLPASGKSTLAAAMEMRLHEKGCLTFTLDGDNVRHGINGDLGFSPQDRQENIRRLAELARLFRDAGVITMTAFISPYKRERDFARSLAGADDFLVVFVDCPVEVCERRDPKGMYRKARQGIIKEYTGVSAPYETPENPEIRVKTAEMTVEQCVSEIERILTEKGLLSS